MYMNSEKKNIYIYMLEFFAFWGAVGGFSPSLEMEGTGSIT